MGIFFIVNPIAGKGRAKDFIREAEPKLIARGIPFKIAYTEGPGHATALAGQVDYHLYSKVISVGGDGTLNEVVNGLDLEKGTLGIIPAGSGNDLIKSLDIPKDEHKALEVVLSGREKRIDLGYINQRRFINVTGIGLDVEVLRETHGLRKMFRGKIAYILGVFKALIHFKSIHVELEIDNQAYQKDIMLCAIGNGRYIGGGMKILPEAKLDDGRMDICLVRKMPKLKLLFLFPKVFSGSHLDLPEVTFLRGKSLRIRSPQETWMNLDGELIQEYEPALRIADQALKILVSP